MYVLLYVRPSTRHIEQLASHRPDFYRIRNLRSFRKLVEKSQISLKSDKNSGYFTPEPMYIYDSKKVNQSRYRPGVAQRVPGS